MSRVSASEAGQEGQGPWTDIWAQKGPSSSPTGTKRLLRDMGRDMLGVTESCLAEIIIYFRKTSPSSTDGLAPLGTRLPGTRAPSVLS